LGILVAAFFFQYHKTVLIPNKLSGFVKRICRNPV